MSNPPDRQLVGSTSAPHDSKSRAEVASRLTSPSISRTTTTAAERHPALEELDPATKFLYTPHTITGLLIGKLQPDMLKCLQTGALSVVVADWEVVADYTKTQYIPYADLAPH